MTKNTYIRNVESVRTGVRDDNSTWELYDITDADGWHFKAFDDKMFFLGPAFENRTEVELTFTETPSDKINPKTKQPYVNRTITSVKVAQRIPAEFEKRLARIEAALTANGILEQ